jgi:hypothetical protein
VVLTDRSGIVNSPQSWRNVGMRKDFTPAVAVINGVNAKSRSGF